MIIYISFKKKSKLSKKRSLFSCCCCKGRTSSISKNSHLDSDKQLSSSLDHNSLSADTAASEVMNLQSSNGGDCPKFCSNSSDSSNNSVISNHSKEYFTIGNRFDPSGISSLLNDVIPDDDDEVMGIVNASVLGNSGGGTLGRNKNYSKNMLKQNGLPSKTFNTYTNHKDLNNKNSKYGSGTSGANNVNMNLMSGTNTNGRYSSNYGQANACGSIRSTAKNQRTSFAFSMRTNLDQDL